MKWLDIVNAWTWPHISDAEFIAAAELLGPLHVHAARTLIQKTSRRIRTIIKINFAFSGMKRTVTESLRQDRYVDIDVCWLSLCSTREKRPQLLEY
jgi:hypothetical protein